MATSRAYDGWAPTYDDPANGIFAIEEPPTRALLDDLPAGVAVGAAYRDAPSLLVRDFELDEQRHHVG